MFLIEIRYLVCKSTKKLKKLKKKVPVCRKFARFRNILYFCSVKRIAYIVPIDYMRGNISGRQDIEYSAGKAYELPDGARQSADNYQPRMIAKVHKDGISTMKYFQIRTKTTVNMSANYRLSLAVLGASGALYASLVSDKSSAIYNAVLNAANTYGIGKTFRAYVIPALIIGLRAKSAQLNIAPNVSIVNPWVSSETPNVPVSQTIIDKFTDVLSA